MDLEFTLLLNGNNPYHKNFIISSNKSGLNIIADTYHFETEELREFLSNYLIKWLDKIVQLKEGHFVLIPVDLADQYTGLLKVEFAGNNYSFTYGYTLDIEGWAIWGEDIFKAYSSSTQSKWAIEFENPFQLNPEEIKESFKLKVIDVARN